MSQQEGGVDICAGSGGVSYRSPRGGRVVYAGVFDSCSCDAAAIEPVSPGCAVRLVARWPQPH